MGVANSEYPSNTLRLKLQIDKTDSEGRFTIIVSVYRLVYTLYYSQSYEREIEQMPVNIITFNIYGVPFSRLTARLERICEIINETDATVINLQQVHTYDVVRQLKRRLSAHKSVYFAPSLLGPCGGLVTFSKLELSGGVFLQVNHASRLLGINAKGMVRVKTKKFTIYNTHLSANTSGDWSTKSHFYPTHKTELAQVSKIIASQPDNLPAIITGDFNIPRDSQLFERFIRNNDFYDALEGDARPTFHKEFLPPGEPGRKIDHILINSPHKITVHKKERLFDERLQSKGVKAIFLSDHVGLYASIAWVL